MNRFKKPGFLKAFERANEKDTSTLLNNSGEDFYAEDVELPSFQERQGDQSEHSEVANSSVKEECSTFANLKADSSINESSISKDDDSVEKSPQRNSLQSKKSTRPMFRKCTSERLDLKLYNNDDEVLGQTTKLVRHESSHITTTKSLFNTCVKEDEATSDSNGDDDDDDKFDDSFCLPASIGSESFDRHQEKAKDDESESSDSSCGLSRAPETKEQIAASSSLKTTAGMIPDMIHPKGLSAKIDRKDTGKKGFSRLSLIARTKKKEKQIEFEESADLEATMVRVDCGDGTETFAQFRLGVRGDSIMEDCSNVAAAPSSLISDDSSSESETKMNEGDGNTEKQHQRVSSATTFENIDHKRNDKRVNEDRKSEGRTASKSSAAKTGKQLKPDPSTSSQPLSDTFDNNDYASSSRSNRQSASKEDTIVSHERRNSSPEIEQIAQTHLEIVERVPFESSPGRKKSSLSKTSHSAPGPDMLDPHMDTSRRSVGSRQDNKLVDTSERKRNKTLRSSEHLRSSRKKNVVADTHSERQRVAKSPSGKVNSKIEDLEELTWIRPPSTSPLKTIKKTEQDVNAVKNHALKSDRKSTKQIANETRSHHPSTPKRSKSPGILKVCPDEALVNSSNPRKSTKPVSQKPKRALACSLHGTRSQDKSEILMNEIHATESSIILPINPDDQHVDLKHVKASRQKSNDDPTKVKHSSHEHKTRSKTTTRKKHDSKPEKDTRNLIESDAESASSQQSIKKTIMSSHDCSEAEDCEAPPLLRRQSSASNMNDVLKLNNLMKSKPPLKRAGSDGTLNCSFAATHEPIPMHDWFQKQHKALLNNHNHKLSHMPDSNSGPQKSQGGNANDLSDLTCADTPVYNISANVLHITSLDENVSPRKVAHPGLANKTKSARNLLASPVSTMYRNGRQERVSGKLSKAKSTRQFATEHNVAGESSGSDRHRRERDLRDRDATSKRKSKSNDQSQDEKLSGTIYEVDDVPPSPEGFRRHKSSSSQSRVKSPETSETRRVSLPESGGYDLMHGVKAKNSVSSVPHTTSSEYETQGSSRYAGESDNHKNRLSLASFLTSDVSPSQQNTKSMNLYTSDNDMFLNFDESNLDSAATLLESYEDMADSAEAVVVSIKSVIETSALGKIEPSEDDESVTEQVSDKESGIDRFEVESKDVHASLDDQPIKARKNLWDVPTPKQNRSRRRSTANIRLPVPQVFTDTIEQDTEQEKSTIDPNDEQQKHDHRSLVSDHRVSSKDASGATAIRKVTEEISPKTSKHFLKVNSQSSQQSPKTDSSAMERGVEWMADNKNDSLATKQDVMKRHGGKFLLPSENDTVGSFVVSGEKKRTSTWYRSGSIASDIDGSSSSLINAIDVDDSCFVVTSDHNKIKTRSNSYDGGRSDDDDVTAIKEKYHLVSAELEHSKRTIEEMSKIIFRLEKEVMGLRQRLGESGDEMS